MKTKQKQNWIFCYGDWQDCISIDIVESFPKNKVLGFVGGGGGIVWFFNVKHIFVHWGIQKNIQ